jgi:hypothetical protein
LVLFHGQDIISLGLIHYIPQCIYIVVIKFDFLKFFPGSWLA